MFTRCQPQSKRQNDHRFVKSLLLLAVIMALQACTSINIDEYKAEQDISISRGETVVVLGRRHSSNYETEPDLISCIADVLEDNNDLIQVIPETQFVDDLYPWLEPRIAPLKVKDMPRILNQPHVQAAFEKHRIRYLIWVDGKTETTSSGGSIGCSIGAGGAGCFGFGTWEKESDYVANLWDFDRLESMGEISADASGTSYMPAIIIPIPIIAQVQKNACKAVGLQLRNFLLPNNDSAQVSKQ